MHWLTVFCALYVSLLPLVCAQGAANVSFEVWIAVGIVTFGGAGIILIIWVIFILRVCRVYCYYRKENREYNTVLTRRQEYEERYRSRQPHVSNDQLEAVALRNTGSPFSSPSQVRRAEPLQRESTTITGVGRSQTNMYQHHFNRLPQSTSNGSNIALMSPSPNSILPMARTSSNSSSQHEMPRSSSNLSGIARLNSNLHGVPRSGSNSSGFETGRTSNTTATTTSGASLYRPSQVHSSHISDHNQLTRLKIATGLSSQLQSLSEVEETDVRPEESLQGPPRYSYLFPEKQKQRISRDNTSPFSFNSEQRGGSRYTGRLQEFNQLSSWPNFNLY